MEHYKSKFTGPEVDNLLTRVQEGKDVAEIREELNKKANTKGYYRSLEVGYADGLKGHEGEATHGVIGFRATAGENNSIEDGSAEIKTIYGDSVVWNQLYNIANTGTNGSTLSYDGGSITATNAENAGYFGITIYMKISKAHRYAVLGHATRHNNDSYAITLGNEIFGTLLPPESVSSSFGVVSIANSDGSAIYLNGITRISNASFTISDLQVIDLTLMFGAGNEPTTIEEYNVRKPIVADEYAYNKGEVVGVNPKGIKSVGDNAWDEQWENGGLDPTNNGNPFDTTAHFRNKGYIRVIPNTQYYFKKPIGIVTYLFFYDEHKNFVKWLDPFATVGEGGVFTTYNAPYMRFTCYMPTYNHDITISLYHSGWKDGQYEPYVEDTLRFGLPDVLHKWDRAYNKNGKGNTVKGTGKVDDMSTLEWHLDTDGYTFYTVDDKYFSGMGLLSSRYTNIPSKDESMNMYAVNGILRAFNSACTDVESFKASLADIPLYYELAEPEVIEYEPAFSNTYKAWDFGTEELLVDGPSCPMPCDIIYSFNALDTIRGNKFKNEEQDRRLLDLERRTVKRDSYAPDLTSGFADNLVGRGESTPAEFSFRASGGKSIRDGAARIKTLRGNAVVWNQKIDKVYVDRDKALVAREGESMISGHKYLLNRSVAKQECYVIVADDFYDYSLYEGQYSIIFTNAYDCVSDGVYPSRPHIYCSGESGYVQLIDLTLMFGAGDEPSTIEEYEARKPIVEDEYAYNEGTIIPFAAEGIKSVGDNALNADRSLVFDFDRGYGDYDFINTEDAFVGISADGYINGWKIDYAEKIEGGFKFRSNGGGYGIGLFVKALPNEEYSVSYTSDNGRIAFGFYDKGKNFISYENWENHFTTPSNCEYIMLCLRDNEVVNIDISFTNIMLTLVHSGWKQDTDAGYQPYWADTLLLNDPRIAKEFPNGMMPWDKVYNKNGKGYIVKGKGTIEDLGALAWDVIEGNFSATPFQTNANMNYGNRLCTNIISAKFLPNTKAYGGPSNEDYICFDSGHIYISGPIANSNRDSASLKNALKDVPLYYELAEPTIIEYDEPFNLDYKVADFGTEEIIASKPSAPLKADIIYQFNAVDEIRELRQMIEMLTSIINKQ